MIVINSHNNNNNKKNTTGFDIIIPVSSPEKVRFGVKLKVSSIDVKVKFWRSGVRHTDGDEQVLWILAQLKRRRYHDDDDDEDGVQTYNNRRAGELRTGRPWEPEPRPIRPQRATLWMNSSNLALLSCQQQQPKCLFLGCFCLFADGHNCQHWPQQTNKQTPLPHCK